MTRELGREMNLREMTDNRLSIQPINYLSSTVLSRVKVYITCGKQQMKNNFVNKLVFISRMLD